MFSEEEISDMIKKLDIPDGAKKLAEMDPRGRETFRRCLDFHKKWAPHDRPQALRMFEDDILALVRLEYDRGARDASIAALEKQVEFITADEEEAKSAKSNVLDTNKPYASGLASARAQIKRYITYTIERINETCEPGRSQPAGDSQGD